MTTTAIFIDGPLAGEVWPLERAAQTLRIPLPPRVDTNEPNIIDYYAVSRGDHHVLYSIIYDDRKAIIESIISRFQAAETPCTTR